MSPRRTPDSPNAVTKAALILRAIVEEPGAGPSFYAERLAMHKSTVCRIAGGLVEFGLVDDTREGGERDCHYRPAAILRRCTQPLPPVRYGPTYIRVFREQIAICRRAGQGAQLVSLSVLERLVDSAEFTGSHEATL